MIALLKYGPPLLLGMFLGVKSYTWAGRLTLRLCAAGYNRLGSFVVLLVAFLGSTAVAVAFWVLVPSPQDSERAVSDSREQISHFAVMFALVAVFVFPATLKATIEAKRAADVRLRSSDRD